MIPTTEVPKPSNGTVNSTSLSPNNNNSNSNNNNISKKKKTNNNTDEDDPILKLRQRLRQIQDKVEKVLEKVSPPDPAPAIAADEATPATAFDIDAWKRERERIRNSRFIDDVEVKLYERRQFADVEIRPGWETRNNREPSVESVESVKEVVQVEEPKPEVAETSPEVAPKSKSLHRSKSIHSSSRSESRTDLRKSSLPHIIISTQIRSDLFKKKPKKGRRPRRHGLKWLEWSLVKQEDLGSTPSQTNKGVRIKWIQAR